MCGIAGFWNLDGRPVSREELIGFTNQISHRGPDGWDVHIFESTPVGFGHRRLAIIDTTDAGRQPMSFAERYWMVFNGELYNFVELRKELESLGYQFKTDSDTEVVLVSYDKWGEDCQFKFNGMWALVIWDNHERKLFKTLYTDFHFTHLPMNLRDFDRLSMAHGVEVCSPFMDWRLVTFAFAIPSVHKIGGGYTKRILRDAMKGILPESIRTRTKKLGFPNLDEGWNSSRGHEFIKDSISSSSFKSSTFWDAKRINSDLELAFQTQDKTSIYKVWKLVQANSLIQMFCEKNKRMQNV